MHAPKDCKCPHCARIVLNLAPFKEVVGELYLVFFWNNCLTSMAIMVHPAWLFTGAGGAQQTPKKENIIKIIFLRKSHATTAPERNWVYRWLRKYASLSLTQSYPFQRQAGHGVVPRPPNLHVGRGSCDVGILFLALLIDIRGWVTFKWYHVINHDHLRTQHRYVHRWCCYVTKMDNTEVKSDWLTRKQDC